MNREHDDEQHDDTPHPATLCICADCDDRRAREELPALRLEDSRRPRGAE